jgi:hypothetical protein
MNEVSVSDGTVAVGTGARLADVYNARAARDRTIAAGWRANRDQQGAALTVSQLVIGSQGA